MSDSIDKFGDPLAFCMHEGYPSALLGNEPASDVIQVESRQMEGHQKEAVVHEGHSGSSWRVCSDEGLHLKGHDLAPFPLGFFNAGLQSDLFLRIRYQAALKGLIFSDLKINLVNGYWLTGSFALGTGEGHADPSEIEIEIQSQASPTAIREVIYAALETSPAIALLRKPLVNTFALYINGRRKAVPDVPVSQAPDAQDPYLKYAKPVRPLVGKQHPDDLIQKTGLKEDGTPQPAPAGTTGRIIRKVVGNGDLNNEQAVIDTYLQMPGTTHFTFRSGDQHSPSGLALLSAGISFCYMTQLSRYIEHMKLAIRGVRMVQFTPFELLGKDSALFARALPIDTHLFLNGEAPDELHQKLLTIAEHTCYLHSACSSELPPTVLIRHNGNVL